MLTWTATRSSAPPGHVVRSGLWTAKVFGQNTNRYFSTTNAICPVFVSPALAWACVWLNTVSTIRLHHAVRACRTLLRITSCGSNNDPVKWASLCSHCVHSALTTNSNRAPTQGLLFVSTERRHTGSGLQSANTTFIHNVSGSMLLKHRNESPKATVWISFAANKLRSGKSLHLPVFHVHE